MRWVHLIVEGFGWCVLGCWVLVIGFAWLFVRALPSNEEMMERHR